MRIQFYSGNLKGTDHFGDLEVDWGDNIKVDIRGIGCKSVDWIHVAWDRFHWQDVNVATLGLCMRRGIS
jgi:hypothetical protein